MDVKTLYKEVVKESNSYGIDWKLVSAVIYQESRGNPYAFRYEPGFYDKYLKGKRLRDLPGKSPRDKDGLPSEFSETRGRACSWGLMQIMGQTAREYDFNGKYLTELIDPVLNIRFGIKILADKIVKSGSEENGLLRYNGGGNINYPKEVMSWRDSGEYSFIYMPQL